MHVEFNRPEEGTFSLSLLVHDLVDFRREQTSLESLAGFYNGTINIGGDDHPERFDGAFVTANTFDVLGVAPVVGRTFFEGDDEPGAPATVLLGYDLWLNRYSGSPEVIGQIVRVNGRDAAVIGVMPPFFRFPFNEDVWVPVVLDTVTVERGEGNGLSVFGRLKDDVSILTC
jgi:hypothetical protein